MSIVDTAGPSILGLYRCLRGIMTLQWVDLPTQKGMRVTIGFARRREVQTTITETWKDWLYRVFVTREGPPVHSGYEPGAREQITVDCDLSIDKDQSVLWLQSEEADRLREAGLPVLYVMLPGDISMLQLPSWAIVAAEPIVEE